MKNINFLTILLIMQYIHIFYINYTRPEIGVDTVDIIWSIYYYSNAIIFIILLCSDIIYTKINNLEK